MSEHTLEQILVLYQVEVTGRPGPPVDSDPERTKELADAIRNVVGNTSITVTGQQLVTSCGFAGIYIDPAVLEGSEDILETEFTFESKSNIMLTDDADGEVYVGLSIHSTEYPEDGYQPLEPDKWPHQVEEVRESVVSAMPVPK